jgi:antitoxin VapB
MMDARPNATEVAGRLLALRSVVTHALATPALCSFLPSACVDATVFTCRQGGARMPLNIRNEAVNRLATKLAARKRINKTEAVKLALENELRRMDEALPLRERLRPLQNRVLSRPATGLQADKAFYDELSGDA